MAVTYEPLATTTLTATSTTITFSSISGSYTDLRVVFIPTGSTTTNIYMRFNSDTGNNYSATNIYGNGSAAGSTRATDIGYLLLTQRETISTTVPQFYSTDIFSYAGSTFKTVLLTENSDRNGSGSVANAVNLWRSTSAITAIDLTMQTGHFNIGTAATLYGITKA